MFAVLLIPDFSLQAVLRREPDLHAKPVALVDPALPGTHVIQLTAAARSQGVTEGLTPSQAMARCADLKIQPRSPAQEEAATDILLQTAYAFSPCIEATSPGVCTMDLKGLGLDSDEQLQRRAEQMNAALRVLDLSARVGIAATPGLALLASRAARPCLVVRDSNTFSAALPVAALEPSAGMSDILERWGIQTVGELIALGRTALAERLGAEVLPLFDRVSPGMRRPLKLVAPKETFEERLEFEHEIETAAPLLFVLRRFVEQLAARVDVMHLVIAELHLELKLGLSESGSPGAEGQGGAYEHRFRIPSPTANVETLFRTVQTHLETVRTDAPIVALRLEAVPCPPETHQFGLFETTLRDPNQFAETVSRLMALCGAERVGTPVLEPTHRVDAFRMKTPQFDAVGRTTGAKEAGDSLISEDGGGRAGLALRRFRPAVAARIEFRGKRPALVRSSALSGAVAEAAGPYLGSGDWWDGLAWSREEWDLQMSDGTLCRIFRSPGGCFVEGVYE